LLSGELVPAALPPMAFRLSLMATAYDGSKMARRDPDWPAHTQWFCCPSCHRLWTLQGPELVVLDSIHALGPALPTEEVPPALCMICEGDQRAPVAEV
ncbi:MAG: hypothetical protein ACE5MM_03475, partial [Nitrospiraceae bacterium]